jgi:hypothetical protein
MVYISSRLIWVIPFSMNRLLHYYRGLLTKLFVLKHYNRVSSNQKQHTRRNLQKANSSKVLP